MKPAIHQSTPQRWLSILLALAIGGTGGWLAFSINLPLPWMIGSMVFTTVGAMMGAPIAMASGLRTAMITILGVMLGSGFTPEILSVIGAWSGSLALVSFYILLSTACGYLYFRRVCGYDSASAYFSATPGGLSEMVLLGGHYGGDARVISLVHATRILLIVIAIPFGFYWLSDLEPGQTGGVGPGWNDIGVTAAILLGLCAIAGFFGARALKVPAAPVVGPMVLSSIVHLFGWTSAAPPMDLVAMAQVAIGTAIGARFYGTSVRMVLRTILHSAGATLLLIVITLGLAGFLVLLTPLGLSPLILAYAPGGLAEMSLIAIALGADAALVATHHIVRIALIVICAGPIYRLINQRTEARKETTAQEEDLP